jgi:glycine oxidase
MTDALVIGAGIIGASCAWRLAQAGLSVSILDRSAPGSEASQAALGVLTFHGRTDVMPEPLQVLSRKSADFFPAIVEELREVTGYQIYFRQEGQLILAIEQHELAELERTLHVNREAGVEMQQASVDEAVLMEPNLNPEIAGALYSPSDAWVDNTALTQALFRAAETAGASFRRLAVTSIESKDGHVTGVRAGKELVEADRVVLAAGCWSGQINGVPRLPVVPQRGQAFSVEGSFFRRVVHSRRAYVVPKGETQTMLGATVEDVGFDTTNTPGGIRDVASRVFEISPQLQSATFIGAWAGLRPGTPDDMPIIGPFDELPNLVIATGHFRNGILLAPITAQLVREVVLGEPTLVDLAPFSPDRDSLKPQK